MTELGVIQNLCKRGLYPGVRVRHPNCFDLILPSYDQWKIEIGSGHSWILSVTGCNLTIANDYSLPEVIKEEYAYKHPENLDNKNLICVSEYFSVLDGEIYRSLDIRKDDVEIGQHGNWYKAKRFRALPEKLFNKEKQKEDEVLRPPEKSGKFHGVGGDSKVSGCTDQPATSILPFINRSRVGKRSTKARIGEVCISTQPLKGS